MRRVIFNFHGLGTPARSLEAGEAAYWVAPDILAGTLDLAERLKTKVDTHFTFDDGNLSDLEIAAPLMAQYGRTATIFVLSARIGLPGSLSAADIQALHKAGHCIGSHGANHVDWRMLDRDGQVREFDTARAKISRVLGTEVTQIAIPFGRYDRSVLQALKGRGYSHIYSSDGGAWYNDCAPIPRTSPRSDMTLKSIEAMMLGDESLVKCLRRRVVRSIKRIR